ncbi:MAG: hypothetical protein KDC07_01415, partial [Chitinophagaceae bacterium]|nr:hypothetical protein [Chitinophagaceae bacterium]
LRLIILCFCMFLFSFVTKAREETVQPNNAVYATLRLYEIINELKTRDSTFDEIRCKKEFFKLVKTFINDTIDNRGYFGMLKSYPYLLHLQNMVFASNFTIEKTSLAVKKLIAETTDSTDLVKLKKLDSLFTSIKRYQEAIGEEKLELLGFEEDLRRYDSLYRTRFSLSNNDSSALLMMLHTDTLTAGWVDSLLMLKKTDSARISAYKESIETTEQDLAEAVETFKYEIQGLRRNLKTQLIATDKDVNEMLSNTSRIVDFSQGLYKSADMDVPPLAAMQTTISLTSSFQGHALSMPSESEMIDALAIFLTDRVKQETVIWFFEQLRANAKLYNDMNVLFPASIKLLRGNEVYETPDLGKAWRYAIAEDFVRMPEHLVNTSYVRAYIDESPERRNNILPYMQTGVSIATALQNKYTLSETLDYLYLSRSHTEGTGITGNDYITLLYAIKQEFFLVDSNTRQWLTPSVLLEMDDDMFMTMLSLTDMKYDRVFSRLAGKNYGRSFWFKKTDVQKLKVWLAKILLNIKKLEAIYAEMERVSADDKTDVTSVNYNVWTYTKNIIGTLESLNIVPAEQNVKDGLAMLAEILDIYREIDRKNYPGAIGKSFDIIEYFYERRIIEQNGARRFFNEYPMLTNDLLAVATGQRTDPAFKDSLQSRFDRTKQNIKVNVDSTALVGRIVYTQDGNTFALADTFISRLRFKRMEDIVSRTGLFLSDVSDARNSKDLSSVVQKYALPPSSYNIKKASLHSWFINAYVGPYVGHEWLIKTLASSATDTLGPDNNGYVYGISAPIGLTYSIPSRRDVQKNDKYVTCFSKGRMRYLGSNPWSFTLSVVDIGAVVSYRISNTDGVLPQKFKWEQFFSPGIHVAKAIYKTPLVVSVSGVYAPLVRSVNTSDRQYTALRLQAGVFFDIPVVKIYAKNRFVKLDKFQEKYW